MNPTDRAGASGNPKVNGRWRWASSSLRWLELILLYALAGASEPPGPRTRSINELKAFYQQNCARCHGWDGSARSLDGKKLGGQDFTQVAFKNLGGPGSEREIRTMTRTIRRGLFFGLSMPAWKDQLSQEEAALLVKEVLLKAQPGKAIAPEQLAATRP